MADAYYRTVYFSLDSPEDLELLGLLFALPRWRRPSAIKSALRQHLLAVLDGPPLGADEVRAILAKPAQVRRRRRTSTHPPVSSGSSPPARQVPERETLDQDAPTPGAVDASDLPETERLLVDRLDQLVKNRWIG
jgi:hypothetical protein